jgi:hypothetical protein
VFRELDPCPGHIDNAVCAAVAHKHRHNHVVYEALVTQSGIALSGRWNAKTFPHALDFAIKRLFSGEGLCLSVEGVITSRVLVLGMRSRCTAGPRCHDGAFAATVLHRGVRARALHGIWRCFGVRSGQWAGVKFAEKARRRPGPLHVCRRYASCANVPIAVSGGAAAVPAGPA